MTTLAAPPRTATAATAGAVPARRTLVGLSLGFLVVFVVDLATSKDPDKIESSAKVTRDFDIGHTMLLVQVGLAVVAAALLVFVGAALRSAFEARTRTWTTAVVGYAFTLGAVALLVLVLPVLWLWHAVDVGDSSAIHTLTIVDTGTFPALMLTFVTTYVSVGIAGWLTRSLPIWLCGLSVLVGAIAPMGRGGFVGFVLFPIWLVVVSALVKLNGADDIAS